MSAVPTTHAAWGIAAQFVQTTASGLTALRWLVWRELIRFVRQPARIIASIGTPAIIWLVLASGFAGSFAAPSESVAGGYAAYLIPGMAAMTVVFASIFAAMSLIEDRAEGFLQGVLISPAPTWAMVGSKVIGGALIACSQAMVIVLAAPALDLPGLTTTPIGLLLAFAALTLMALGVIGLGLGAAWWVNSNAGFHGVMNLVLMPMLLLSGAFFPSSGASPWMRWLMQFNPLTWPTQALRASVGLADHSFTLWLGSAAFAVVGCAIAGITMARGRSRINH